MAREQRHDVDYFPHPCKHGRKMYIIETKYGNDGYAVWMKLLEELGASNDHFLDVSDEMNFLYLTSVFKVDLEVAKEILTDLAKLGAIDKNLYEKHQIIFSEKFVQSVSDAYKKRKSNPLTASDILQKVAPEEFHSATETIQTATETFKNDAKTNQSGGNQVESIPKEKKSKEKKRKEERNAGAKPPTISLAYDLIQKEKPAELQTFEMQNKKSIENWDKLIRGFNNKIDFEISQGKIAFESDQLMPRFRMYFDSWQNNEQKFEKAKKEQQASNPTSNIPIG